MKAQTASTTEATFSSADLAERSVHRRAVEAVIWGMPAVNFYRMYQAMVHDAKADEGTNKIVYWSRLFNWKDQTLTRTPTRSTSCHSSTQRTPVRSCSRSTRRQSSITGSIHDCWQAGLRGRRPSRRGQGQRRQNTSFCPRTTKTSFPRATFPCSRTTTKAMHSCAPSLRRAMRLTLSKPSSTASVKIYPLSQAAHPPPT